MAFWIFLKRVIFVSKKIDKKGSFDASTTIFHLQGSSSEYVLKTSHRKNIFFPKFEKSHFELFRTRNSLFGHFL